MVPQVVRGRQRAGCTLGCWLKHASTEVLPPVQVPAGRGEQGPGPRPVRIPRCAPLAFPATTVGNGTVA